MFNTLKYIYKELISVPNIRLVRFNFLCLPYEISFNFPETDFSKWYYWQKQVKLISQSQKVPISIDIKENQINIKFLKGKDCELNILKEALEKKYYLISEPEFEKITIILKVTNQCNLNCYYCYDVKFREKLGHNGFMPLETIDKVIDVASTSTKELCLIFHGGEPTLPGVEYYKRIFNEILPKYPFLKVSTSIQSNGTLIDFDWYNLSQKYSLEIGFSNNLYHECLRDNKILDKNGKNLLIEKIKKSRIAGCQGIGCIEVVNSENIKDLIKIYNGYKKQKIDVCFNLIFEAGSAAIHNEQILTFAEYKKYIKPYFEYWLKDKDAVHDRFAERYFRKILNCGGLVCTDYSCDFKFLGINSNGDIYPCDRPLDENYRMGNVWEFDNISQIFSSEPYKKYINELSAGRRKYCSICSIESFCKSDCPMKKYDTHYKFDKPNFVDCAVQKLLLRIAYDLLCEIKNFEQINPILLSSLSEYTRLLPYETKMLIDDLKPNNLNFNQGYNGFLSEEFFVFKTFNDILCFEDEDENCKNKKIRSTQERIELIKKAIKKEVS